MEGSMHDGINAHLGIEDNTPEPENDVAMKLKIIFRIMGG